MKLWVEFEHLDLQVMFRNGGVVIKIMYQADPGLKSHPTMLCVCLGNSPL